jgi:hypothetical protein
MKDLIGADFSNKFFTTSVVTLIGIILLGSMAPELLSDWIIGQQGIQRDLIREEIEAYMGQTINSTVYRTLKPYSYILGQVDSGGTTYYFAIKGWTGQLVNYSTSVDPVLEFMDDNVVTQGSIAVLNGTYNTAEWTSTKKLRIIGLTDNVIFNLTDNNYSWDFEGDVTFVGLNISSVVDGIAHIRIDGSRTEFREVDFNFNLSTGAEQGVIKFLGASPGDILFYDCTLKGGDSGAIFYFMDWQTAINDIIIDGFIVTNIETSATNGYAKMFSTSNNAAFDTIDARNILIEDWQANGTTDSAFFYDAATGAPTNDVLGNVLRIDGFIYEGGSNDQSGDVSNQQLAICGIMADYHFLSHIYAGDRVHFYAGFKHTVFSDSIIRGDSLVQSGFDAPTAPNVWPRSVTVDNVKFYNSSLDFNSYFYQIQVIGCSFFGSRLLLACESVTGSPKEVIISDCFWYFNNTDGTDEWNRAIEIQQWNVNNIRRLTITDSTCWNMNSFIVAGTGPTPGCEIIVDGLFLGPDMGAANPIFISAAARGADNNISVSNSVLYMDAPPLDTWTLQAGDRFENVKMIDIDTGVTFYSEYMHNFTISSGSNSATVTHKLPTKGPESYLLVSLTSDAANCTGVYTAWADFSTTQFIVKSYDGGAQKIVNDDVTGIVEVHLTP